MVIFAIRCSITEAWSCIGSKPSFHITGITKTPHSQENWRCFCVMQLYRFPEPMYIPNRRLAEQAGILTIELRGALIANLISDTCRIARCRQENFPSFCQPQAFLILEGVIAVTSLKQAKKMICSFRLLARASPPAWVPHSGDSSLQSRGQFDGHGCPRERTAV